MIVLLLVSEWWGCVSFLLSVQPIKLQMKIPIALNVKSKFQFSEVIKSALKDRNINISEAHEAIFSSIGFSNSTVSMPSFTPPSVAVTKSATKKSSSEIAAPKKASGLTHHKFQIGIVKNQAKKHHKFYKMMSMKFLRRRVVTSCKGRNIAFYKDVGVVSQLKVIDAKNLEVQEFHRTTNNAFTTILRKKLNMLWTYNSLALEGNSLSYGDTIFFLENGLTVEGKPIKDFLEAQGHIEAIESLQDYVCGSRELSNFFFCDVNQLLTGHVKFISAIDEKGIKVSVPFTSGQFRTNPTHVLTKEGMIHKYVEAWKIPTEVHDLVEYCKETKETVHPVVRAAVAHYNMVRIHPFQDGNGRGARILMNLILIKGGFPPVAVQVADRAEYLSALRSADEGDIAPFVSFIASTTIKTLDVLLDTIEKELK